MSTTSYSSIFIATVLAIVIFAEQNDNKPIVSTRFGQIRGVVHTIPENSLIINAFYGVPYAQPPIGKLRFEKPKPLHEWKGVRLAQHYPISSCVPHARPDSPKSENANYSEDCLYMNIFTPHHNETASKSKFFPVLMIIHGGAYELGSTIRYSNYKNVATKFVAHGVILVAVEYRLGVTGFASLGDDVFSGNYGLWDLAEALHFTHENIDAFGGDSDRITLYGHSAGAAAVSSLGISPYTRDQFKAGIQLSGSLIAARMTNERVVNETKLLALLLGCGNMETNSTALKECLKTKTVDEFFNAVEQMGATRVAVNFVKFGPRPDGIFFPKDHPFLISESPPKPTIMGFVEEEALIYTLFGGNTSMTAYAIPFEKRGAFGERDVAQFVREVIATSENFALSGAAVARRVQDKIIYFYCRQNAPRVKDNVFYLQRYTQILSDVLYVVAIVWESRLKAQMNWPLYLYWNAHVNEKIFPKTLQIKESFHGYDDNLLFPSEQFSYQWDKNDKKIQSILLEGFINFIKDGRPTLSEIDWPRTIPTAPMKYLKINKRGQEVSSPLEIRDQIAFDRLKFWLQLMEEFPEFNVIRGTHHPEYVKRDEL